MTIAYTTNRLAKPTPGTEDGSWGTPNNLNFDKIDARNGNVTSIDISTMASTRTIADNDTAVSEADSAVLRLTGTMTSSKTIELPSYWQGFLIIDLTGRIASGQTLIIKNNGEVDGNGVSIDFKFDEWSFVIFSDGTNTKVVKGTEKPWMVGEVRMWTGTLSELNAAADTGWYLCNGSNGTVDLRGKFVYGSTSFTQGGAAEGDIGFSGGSQALTTSSETVDITGTTDNHTLTEAQLPAHRHFGFAVDNPQNDSSPQVSSSNQFARSSTEGGTTGNEYRGAGTSTSATVGRTSTTGSGQGHNHNVNISATGDHSHSVTDGRPPYYTLAYIQYTGVLP